MALDPITAGIDLVGTILNKFIPDKDQAAKAQAEYQIALLTVQQAQLQAQADTNKVEAASSSTFVAGWRPFIGWVCGCALAWAFVFQPICSWIATLQKVTVTFPAIQSDQLFQLVLAMLGMAGWRSLDKMNGVASK